MRVGMTGVDFIPAQQRAHDGRRLGDKPRGAAKWWPPPFLPIASADCPQDTCVMRVAQFPTMARVPPQVGSPFHGSMVHVGSMNSEAIHTEVPSTTAAP